MSTRPMARPVHVLSYRQAMLLQGVLPIVVVAVLLPLGLVAAFLAIKDAPLDKAVSHGELFLSAGNAAFTGCIVLIAARPDKALTAAIASLFSLVLLVFPCYGVWAFISVDVLIEQSEPPGWTTIVGAVSAAGSVAISMLFVRHAYRTTP